MAKKNNIMKIIGIIMVVVGFMAILLAFPVIQQTYFNFGGIVETDLEPINVTKITIGIVLIILGLIVYKKG